MHVHRYQIDREPVIGFSIDLDAHIKTKVRSGSSVAISATPGFARPGPAVSSTGWLYAGATGTIKMLGMTDEV